LADREEPVPADVWCKIAERLDATQVSDDALDLIFKPLKTIEVEAPASGLAHLSARLEADELAGKLLDSLFKSALREYQPEAPIEGWLRVATALPSAPSSARPIRTASISMRPKVQWAVAASFAGLLLLGLWALVNLSQSQVESNPRNGMALLSQLPALPAVRPSYGSTQPTTQHQVTQVVANNISYHLQPSTSVSPLVNEARLLSATNANPVNSRQDLAEVASLTIAETLPLVGTSSNWMDEPKPLLAETEALEMNTPSKIRLKDRVAFREMPIALETRRVEDGRFWRVNLRNIGVEFSGFRAIAAENAQ
jgi:hypothetical protein